MIKLVTKIHSAKTQTKFQTMLSKLNPIRNRRRRLGRSGATAVEFALIAPTFLIVIVICVEFARLSILRNTSHNACYETCRFIISEGATVKDGRDKAQAVLDRLGHVEATILVNGADGSVDENGDVVNEIDFETGTVETVIQIRLADNTLFLPGTVFGDKTIQSRLSMRTERYVGFFDANDIE